MKEFITEVNIIDSIMGSGKSHTMLSYMVENKDKEKFVYITPYLNEVDRVLAHEGLEISRPIGTVAQEKERATELGIDLDLISGTNVHKYKQVNAMVSSGLNVVSTHETFKRLDSSPALNEYTLILDEVVKLVDIYEIKMNTVRAFESEGYIEIDDFTGKINPTERGLAVWSKTETNLTKFLNYAKKGLLYKAVEKVIITEYPIDLISQFKKVYILTYIFEGSYLKAFMDMHGVKYKTFILDEDRSIVEWNEEIHKKQIEPYRELFNLHSPSDKVVKGNYNHRMKTNVGSISSSACSRMSKDTCREINNTIRCYAISVGAKSDDFIYTVFKDVYNRAGKSVKGYTNNFLPYNTKATNDYRYATTVAYCVARYVNPILKKYMVNKAKENGFEVIFSDEKLALADLLQFIFRGCIRDKKPMNLFIGDESTRKIFLKWLNK